MKKSTLSGLLLGLASMGLLGVAGCSEPNEKEVQQASSGPGKKTTVVEGAPEKPEDVYQYQMEMNKKGNPTAQGYQKASGGGGAAGRR